MDDFDVHKGTKVSFFNGRKPSRGVVEEIQDDGRVVVITPDGSGGVARILKDADELRPYEAIQGKKANIRFV